MKRLLDKIFLRSSNLDFISQNIKKLIEKTPVDKILKTINTYSRDSEIRYVGGCVRKIISREEIDDIDLSTNLSPSEVCEALKKENINFYETGIDHGTVTAVIDKYKFEITSLREDISADGRHAKVKFSKDWKKDASRRDFTINAIYADKDGNLFDPYDGKNDLEKGHIKFIGDADIRIKEDYLRILRYIRFFLNYSKHPHDLEIIRKIKINIEGVSKLSKERLLDELEKILKLETLEKLNKDKQCLDLMNIIFPELKNVKIFSNLNGDKRKILRETDFIFLLSLMIIDDTDNTDYFLYKFNVSKKNKKRIKIIDNFYKEKINSKMFSQAYIDKFLYHNGKQAVIDILNFKIIKSKKSNQQLFDLIKIYENKDIPVLPIKAEELMKKYHVPGDKNLGSKLKLIEKEWIDNNFKISDHQVDNIMNG